MEECFNYSAPLSILSQNWGSWGGGRMLRSSDFTHRTEELCLTLIYIFFCVTSIFVLTFFLDSMNKSHRNDQPMCSKH